MPSGSDRSVRGRKNRGLAGNAVGRREIMRQNLNEEF
jgi:hypothetical protein